MKASRRSLRTRLLVAMASIAVGVLVVTGATTVALARRSAERTAVSHLQEQAPGVAAQLRTLSTRFRTRLVDGQSTLAIGRLLISVVRVTGGTVLTVNADGSIAEGLTRPSAAGGGVVGGAAARVNQLPSGLTVASFDTARLLRGEQQSGTVAGRVFVAEPISVTAESTSVLVLTERIDSAAITRARGFFLVGGALALVTAILVSYFLARRLTRPLAAMGATAGAIAGGDLAARVDLGRHPDDELADLASTLNGMAVQLEQARSSERSFLLSVSHDLRTPLTSIRGFSAALTDGTIPATDEQRRAGEVIAAEVARLERLVADLLDLARLDAHQFSLTPRRFDVAGTVRTAVEAFMPAAIALAIELAVEAPDVLPGTGDPERVAQVVANLAENALKYARARIDVYVESDGAGGVTLRVVDDGPGVDPTEVHRVFERLFVSRAEPGRSVGTGLGLAIVGELTTAMGGTASARQTGMGGAEFVVQIPGLAEVSTT